MSQQASFAALTLKAMGKVTRRERFWLRWTE
jgi:hypothetical protein